MLAPVERSLNPEDGFLASFPLTEGCADPVAANWTIPEKILFEELNRAQASLRALGIGFSVSHAELRQRGGKLQKPPYLCCRFNAGDLGNVNVVAYWELMERDAFRFQQRIRAAIGEEMIHALQIVAVRRKYYQRNWPSASYHNAESFYEHLLGAIIDELATTTEGKQAVLIAAQLYYRTGASPPWSGSRKDALCEIEDTLQTINETRNSSALNNRCGYFTPK